MNSFDRNADPASEPLEEPDLTTTVGTGVGPDGAAAGDVISDPARSADVGADWADEGGAITSGPATAAPEND